MRLTLWRAAADDYVPDAASFARNRADAEAYLDNPSFGGGVLFRTRVETDVGRVLNLYDERLPAAFLAAQFGLRHPGALGVEEWIPMDPAVQEALAAAGYDWVIVRDSFPPEAETWLWIGPFDREPELTSVAVGASRG
jgi:hypothetical protein